MVYELSKLSIIEFYTDFLFYEIHLFYVFSIMLL